jgi:hypothetical protein
LNAPDVRDNRSNASGRRYLINSTVRKAEDGDFTDAEHSGGGSQLRLANDSHF